DLRAAELRRHPTPAERDAGGEDRRCSRRGLPPLPKDAQVLGDKTRPVRILRLLCSMKRNVVAMLLIGALACTDSNAPAPAVHQFDILPAGATVAAGVSVTFVAQRQDSTVDAWRVSDSSAARIASYGNGWALVQTRAAGTVTITAARMGDTGQATLVILPPPPPPPDTKRSGLTISPEHDTVTIGQVVAFLPPEYGIHPRT